MTTRFLDSLFPTPHRPEARMRTVGPLRRLLALAFNSAAERCIAYSIATNIAPITEAEAGDEYKLLAPYGDTDYWIEDGKGGFKKLIQRFTPPQATKIVAAFNAYRVRQGTNFIGMPIYRGHPDANRVLWPDERRYGHILDVQQRADGLYVKPAWNDLGLDNKKNHYLPYPSIAWLYDEAAAARTGIIEPDEIQSVGLTNQPRMKNVPVWTNTEEPASAPTNKEKEKTTMPKWLIDKLVALNVLTKPADGVEPSEQELQAAVGRLAVNTDPMEIALGQKKISVVIAGDNRETFLTELAGFAVNATAATEESKKFRKLAINAHLDRAIDKGVITAAERPQWATDLEADFEGALVKLTAKRTALNTNQLDPLKPVNQADLSTPRGRQLAFNVRVDEIVAQGRKDNPRFSIDDAIQKMRATPADAALLKAMEPAATT
jgi:phage I-like protein